MDYWYDPQYQFDNYLLSEIVLDFTGHMIWQELLRNKYTGGAIADKSQARRVVIHKRVHPL